MKAEKAIKLGKCSECKKALYSNEDIHYEGRRKYCVPCHAALIETRMNETVADRDRKLVAKTVALRQETAEERYLTEFEKWVWRYKKMTPHEHPSPAYHTFNLPVFVNENEGTFHYINPELFESGELPERFRNVCKLMDIHTAGCADGTFFLWHVFVSSSKWRKAAIKSVQEAQREFVIVSSIKARQTYNVEIADQLIPEPKWASLPSFEQMLMDAFDSNINVADDKVVLDYMSGGVAAREDEEDVE